MFVKTLTRLAISQIIETIKKRNFPPFAPNHIPKPEAMDIITPTMKYGDVRYSSSATLLASHIKGNNAMKN